MSVYPSTLPKTGGSWQSLTHEYRRVDAVNYTGQPQSSSTETLYVLWVDEVSAGTWHTNGYHHGTEIKVTHSTDVWSDVGTNDPLVAANNANSTHIDLRNPATPPTLLYQFLKPTPTSGGGGGGGGTGTESVNVPYVTWIFADDWRPCGQLMYVRVAHTAATSSVTSYGVYDNTGLLGTIVVGTGATDQASHAFIKSARTITVKDSSGSVLATRVFTCNTTGKKKANCNFW